MIANYPSNFGRKKEIECIMERSCVRPIVSVPAILKLFRSLLFAAWTQLLCQFNVDSYCWRISSYLNKPATGFFKIKTTHQIKVSLVSY